jgi:hypothetical protein
MPRISSQLSNGARMPPVIRMAVEVLGDRVEHNVRAVLERPRDHRAGGGGINGENGTCLVGDVRHLADIDHIPGWVNRRFHPEKFRTLHCRLHGGLIGHVHVFDRDAASAGHVVQQVAAAPVENVRRDDLATGLQRFEQTGKAGEARGIDHRGVAAFECGNDALSMIDGFVAVARIEVLADELIVVIAGIGGGGVERRHDGAGGLVHGIQRLRGNGLGAALAVRHAGRH